MDEKILRKYWRFFCEVWQLFKKYSGCLLYTSLEDLDIAEKSAKDLQDESTKELEISIANIEETNRKVRANLDKEKAEEDAQIYRNQYAELTEKLEEVRTKKTELLSSAELPLPELSVANSELIYKGQKWDNMSGSERLKDVYKRQHFHHAKRFKINNVIVKSSTDTIFLMIPF